MDTARLFARISELQTTAGFGSIRAICVAAGVAPDFLRDVKVGRNKAPAIEKMAKVAAALGVDVDDLLDAAGMKNAAGRPSPLRRPEVTYCRVIGQVEAGSWREALEWLPERQYEIPVLKDNRYPGARRFGLLLGGDSMNLLYPMPRTVIICVPFLDIERAPQPGEIVVAQRQRHDLFEATCKAFTMNGDAAYLEPRSNNASHKAIRLVHSLPELRKARANKETAAVVKSSMSDIPRDVDVVDISGLVIGAYVEQ